MSFDLMRYGFWELNHVRIMCTSALIVTPELVVKSTPADPEDVCR